jgi:hypothetical protein
MPDVDGFGFLQGHFDPWLFEFRGACPLHSDPVAAALILPELPFSLRTVFWAGVRMGSRIRAPALQEGRSLAGIKLFST